MVKGAGCDKDKGMVVKNEAAIGHGSGLGTSENVLVTEYKATVGLGSGPSTEEIANVPVYDDTIGLCTEMVDEAVAKEDMGKYERAGTPDVVHGERAASRDWRMYRAQLEQRAAPMDEDGKDAKQRAREGVERRKINASPRRSSTT